MLSTGAPDEEFTQLRGLSNLPTDMQADDPPPTTRWPMVLQYIKRRNMPSPGEEFNATLANEVLATVHSDTESARRAARSAAVAASVVVCAATRVTWDVLDILQGPEMPKRGWGAVRGVLAQRVTSGDDAVPVGQQQALTWKLCAEKARAERAQERLGQMQAKMRVVGDELVAERSTNSHLRDQVRKLRQDLADSERMISGLQGELNDPKAKLEREEQKRKMRQQQQTLERELAIVAALKDKMVGSPAAVETPDSTSSATDREDDREQMAGLIAEWEQKYHAKAVQLQQTEGDLNALRVRLSVFQATERRYKEDIEKLKKRVASIDTALTASAEDCRVAKAEAADRAEEKRVAEARASAADEALARMEAQLKEVKAAAAVSIADAEVATRKAATAAAAAAAAEMAAKQQMKKMQRRLSTVEVEQKDTPKRAPKKQQAPTTPKKERSTSLMPPSPPPQPLPMPRPPAVFRAVGTQTPPMPAAPPPPSPPSPPAVQPPSRPQVFVPTGPAALQEDPSHKALNDQADALARRASALPHEKQMAAMEVVRKDRLLAKEAVEINNASTTIRLAMGFIKKAESNVFRRMSVLVGDAQRRWENRREEILTARRQQMASLVHLLGAEVSTAPLSPIAAARLLGPELDSATPPPIRLPPSFMTGRDSPEPGRDSPGAGGRRIESTAPPRTAPTGRRRRKANASGVDRSLPITPEPPFPPIPSGRRSPRKKLHYRTVSPESPTAAASKQQAARLQTAPLKHPPQRLVFPLRREPVRDSHLPFPWGTL
eukprot:TRINITY_DN7697_c0_g2_i1.p1 TRINITY_DN7697_c0_g2~~TRINITY_DN7697_c0_g2_i1.p1  ORF type:complete len:793 (+),score=287.62 TRINITY_DN7697_c0_g2_i1:51-2381(+)